MELLEIELKIKEIVVELLELDIDPEEIDSDELLIEGGINIDSLALIQIIDNIEEIFNIECDEEEIGGEIFTSIKTLALFVENKLNMANC